MKSRKKIALLLLILVLLVIAVVFIYMNQQHRIEQDQALQEQLDYYESIVGECSKLTLNDGCEIILINEVTANTTNESTTLKYVTIADKIEELTGEIESSSYKTVTITNDILYKKHPQFQSETDFVNTIARIKYFSDKDVRAIEVINQTE